MKLIMENWKNFLQEDCQDGYERVPGSKEFAQGSCVKKTDEGADTRDTYGSEVEDRNRRSRKRGAAKLVGEEEDREDEKELKKIRKELEGASKMHKSQADRIGDIMKEEELNEIELEEKKAKKRDACYHKVKSRYEVWPSAYASGALVKCRKVGAANWGKSKKEHLQSIIEDELTKILQEKKQASKEKHLGDWFDRKGEKGSKGGWVDCNAPDGDGGYKECAQGDRKEKPYCRPTPSACKEEPKSESLNRIIDEEIEAFLAEKKKKPCKPSKGKRFAKRVDGKCRSYGQAGQAKGGGDRIRPGTAKADAYCARSAKIKKCKNPPCANTLSRKKWKCRGSKSVA
tara:strand:- start:469 stop:1497 length:1029 start_codon:yes stop_codon:yes gene_type:complete